MTLLASSADLDFVITRLDVLAVLHGMMLILYLCFSGRFYSVAVYLEDQLSQHLVVFFCWLEKH